MNLKNILMIFYLVVSASYMANFQASAIVFILFLVNFGILTFITYYHLYVEKVFSPFLTAFIVFNYIFFFVAPISQINDMLSPNVITFVNNFPYKENLIVKTSILIAVFNIFFFLSYDYLKKRRLPKIFNPKAQVIHRNFPAAIIFMAFVSLVICFTNLDFIIYEYNRPEWMQSEYTKSFALIRSKVLFIFPLGAIIACRSYFSQKNKTLSNIYIVVFFLVLLVLLLSILKSPLITKRHDLGPILILSIYLFFPKLLNSNAKFFTLLFFSIIIGLPIAQIFTHTDYGIMELIEKPSRLLYQINNGIFTDGYVSLNYDAFMNIGVVIEVVNQNGLSYGFQLLSGLLFFMPRTLWTGKPNASGTVVGSHLDNYYDFHFQNVSNPFISEAYHNFGLIGIVLFGVILAVFCVKMLLWLHSKSWLKRGFALFSAIHLIFILRGDFTSSFAYLIATFLGIYILPQLIISLSNNYLFWKSKKTL